MKLKFCMHVNDISLYRNLILCFNRISTLVTMATIIRFSLIIKWEKDKLPFIALLLQIYLQKFHKMFLVKWASRESILLECVNMICTKGICKKINDNNNYNKCIKQYKMISHNVYAYLKVCVYVYEKIEINYKDGSRKLY